MPTAQYGVSLTIGGVSISKSAIRENEGVIAVASSIPGAKAVSSWVKTDADTAAGDLAGGHGWTTGTFDVYWDGGARHDVTVTITTNALALDGGTGDDFPSTANTTVVLAQQTQVNVSLDGDEADIVGLLLESLSASDTFKGRLLFEDADGDDIADVDVNVNQPYVYDVAGTGVNPFTGDPITKCLASHGSTSAQTLKIVALVDSTP